MPLASRREEIDRFIAGQAEVCAATDVLGHGVNLPCETLLFAETTKFDGKERRDLSRGRSRRSPAVPGASASTSAAMSACSPACRGRIPTPSSSNALVPHVPIDERPPRLPRRRQRPAAPAALGPQRDARRRARAGAPRLAPRCAALLERRRLARGRVDPAAARAARRCARCAAPRAPEARAGRRVEARAGAGRRGQRAAAGNACRSRRRRQAAADGARLDPRSAPPRRGGARGSRGGRARGVDSPLVRAAVSGRRRSHDRAAPPRWKKPRRRVSCGSCGPRSRIRRSAAVASVVREPHRGRRFATGASWLGATEPAGARGSLSRRVPPCP